MKARLTIEYELDWTPGLTLVELREREVERWMTNEAVLGLPQAKVKIDLSPSA